MYSWEGLLDFKNEEYVVFYLFSGHGSAILLLLILEYLSIGDRLWLLSLEPICLLPQA